METKLQLIEKKVRAHLRRMNDIEDSVNYEMTAHLGLKAVSNDGCGGGSGVSNPTQQAVFAAMRRINKVRLPETQAGYYRKGPNDPVRARMLPAMEVVDPVEWMELKGSLLVLLDGQPERDILYLHYFNGKTISEVAHKMGKTNKIKWVRERAERVLYIAIGMAVVKELV